MTAKTLSLLCSASLLLVSSCGNFADPVTQWNVLSEDYRPGTTARVAEKGAALFHKPPTDRLPDAVLAYGEEVEIIQASAQWTIVRSERVGDGMVSTMALIPVQPKDPNAPGITTQAAEATKSAASKVGATAVAVGQKTKAGAAKIPLVGRLFD